MTKPRLHGLYAITKATGDNEDRLFDDVAAAIRGGAAFIQYRDKFNNPVHKQRIAHRLCLLCREYGARLIINDDIDLCLAVKADGVHLGQDDASPGQARARLGENKIIGVSCYNQQRLAVQAQRNGADYVAFGSFFNSATKPEAVSAPLSLLTETRTKLSIPIVAIGGINIDNARQLVDAGADALAVINGVFDQTDVAATAQAFSELFK